MTMLTELTEMGKWEAIKTEYAVVTIFMDMQIVETGESIQTFVVIVHKLEMTSSTVEGSSNCICILK